MARREDTPPRRYLPAEDTYLLREALEPFSGGSCLEIGFGSGAVIASASARFDLAVGTDIIDLGEARLARSAGVDLVLADGASCFRDGSFDLVFFNPPYLPSESVVDRAVDGGPTGIEVPTVFLEEALRVARGEGAIVVLLSDVGALDRFVRFCGRRGLEAKRITSRKLFYEELVVLRIQRKEEKKKKKGEEEKRESRQS